MLSVLSYQLYHLKIQDIKWIKVLLNKLDRIIDYTGKRDVFFGNHRQTCYTKIIQILLKLWGKLY